MTDETQTAPTEEAAPAAAPATLDKSRPYGVCYGDTGGQNANAVHYEQDGKKFGFDGKEIE